MEIHIVLRRMRRKKNPFSPSTMYMRLTRNKVEEDRARKGYVPVLVGKEAMMERILLPTKLIEHPYVVSLLELSAKEYGYEQQGLLQIPYDADCFKRIIESISKEKQS